MSDRLKALREKRGRIVREMRDIIDGAQKDKRDLTDEELAKHRELFNAQDALKTQIDAEEATAEAERALAAAAGPDAERARKASGEGDPAARPAGTGERHTTPEYRAAFRNWLRYGRSGLSIEEHRALQFTGGGTGENTRAPEEFITTLIKKLDDDLFIRNLATKHRLDSAKSMGAPSLDADPADADWTTELATGSEDATMAFGKRLMTPNPLAKRIKVSNDLLQFSALDIEGLVRDRLGYKFGVALEKAYLTGNGTAKPLGLFVASANGIPATRDVATGANRAAGITFDGIISALYSLKAGYQRNARWLFHRDIVASISKLKDTDGQYLWNVSRVAGEPDRILGKPVLQSEFAPNTVAASAYVGMIADYSYYWIVDSMDLVIQRLVELYAETNQTGFIGRLFSDGAPVLAEAFTRLQLPAT
jgi:HK97 family phage major capsid protein